MFHLCMIDQISTKVGCPVLSQNIVGDCLSGNCTHIASTAAFANALYLTSIEDLEIDF